MSDTRTRNAAGYVSFVLHSHLPYVVNHGRWPHGEDWLYEAAAETYLPLLRVFRELEEDGLALKANVNLSPILLEQLVHPQFKQGFRAYLRQKIDAARKDADEFARAGETHFVHLAEFWQRFYEGIGLDFEHHRGDIVGAFRHFYETSAIEIITCGATHGYFALLGTDASIRAQVKLGVETHTRLFGRKPRGIWLPECSYRPAGDWRYPVSFNGARPPISRAGIEQILGEAGIEFFFVDTHLVERKIRFTPYEILAGDVPIAAEVNGGGDHYPSPYVPYWADTPLRNRYQVSFFTRDAATGIQVWSGEHGYPGDPVYLDFHKKRWPGGHRYWQVTHPKIDLGAKTAYFPELARQRTRVHAMHFSDVSSAVLRQASIPDGYKPILTAPFDAELFGHWWFEGPEWLKNVVREYAHPGHPLQLITCAEYLDNHQPSGFVGLPEGSWGRNGNHEVWLNPETEWTWKHIYPAELAVEEIASSRRWQGHEAATRVAKQLCRELLLLESSDWQFLITTKHARDYAEKRFREHLEQFRTLLDSWRRYESSGQVPADAMQKLEEIESRDSVFPEVTPELWSRRVA